jgi:ferrous iron transport protein B
LSRSLPHIALVGNPNIGKTSLFNCLTGLNQKVGNFPGVTVDKKTGRCKINERLEVNIVDLPGTYSLYPKRTDEWVAYNLVMGMDQEVQPDMIVLIADASNLKRNLLFTSQLIDLKQPLVVALSMMDIAASKGIKINIPDLERELGVPVIPVNPLKNKGIPQLKKAIEQIIGKQYHAPVRDFIDNQALASKPISSVKEIFPGLSNYAAIHYLINHESFPLTATQQQQIEQIEKDNEFNATRVQAEEIVQRYGRIRLIMRQSVIEDDQLKKSMFTERLDGILLHRIWGYVILLSVLFFLFQSVFWLAQYPMDAIEWIFAKAGNWLTTVLPDNSVSDLFINGIVAGLSGILVFVPQIMILFGLITLLEDSGYMARISFLTDRIMRKTGMNGKSVMPLISGMACAVPAIMSARNIENRKERLLTIMVTPLMSCSARLPVYTILIALVIPNTFYIGFLSLQGLVMMGLYMLGFVMALIVSSVMSRLIKLKEKSFFILELPVYRSPRWKNALITMLAKAKIFVVDAGKIIMLISIILWALKSYGPKEKMQAVTAKYTQLKAAQPDKVKEIDKQQKAEYLENSYAGILGKTIEPVIRPLGFDWKIGIALVTSFAAREVFVGTMATLYSEEEDVDENSSTLRQKMAAARRTDGKKVYDLPTGLSLLVFYVLAMQCMSTLAVVKRETQSWKWPVIQLIYMSGLAYLMSLLVYFLFSL